MYEDLKFERRELDIIEEALRSLAGQLRAIKQPHKEEDDLLDKVASWLANVEQLPAD